MAPYETNLSEKCRDSTGKYPTIAAIIA